MHIIMKEFTLNMDKRGLIYVPGYLFRYDVAKGFERDHTYIGKVTGCRIDYRFMSLNRIKS
jgi:hypothetical protein